MSPEDIDKRLVPGAGPFFLELKLISSLVHALIDGVDAAQFAPEVGAYLFQGRLEEATGMWELEASTSDSPDLGVSGLYPILQHETAEGMERTPKTVLVANPPVGLWDGSAG